MHSNPFHSMNGNFMWFKAYASIVHGARGIWFWWFPEQWQHAEPTPDWGSGAHKDYYPREHFPEFYRELVGPLARELRLLRDKGLLDNFDLPAKRDQADSLGLLQDADQYLKEADIPNHMCNENYGIRYRVLKNEHELVIMAVNPLPVTVDVPLDFSVLESLVNSGKAVGMEKWFSPNADVNGTDYKSDR